MSRTLHVDGDWIYDDWIGDGSQSPTSIRHIGLLRAELIRGKEVFAFEYDQDWLQGKGALALDPELQMFPGPQYVDDSQKPNFGMFLDSAPDRWGKLLMQRKEALVARDQGRPVRTLMELDFLLGVHDEQRLGGLRFKENIDGPYLSDDDGLTTPPWARLRDLEEASWQLQTHESAEVVHVRTWLNMLLAPGSSLGGARPKAGVCDEQGNLWIAKFPGRDDTWDVGAWEMVVHRLAVEAGLEVPPARMERFARRHHTFMSQRFDRCLQDGQRRRRHFASAMTMLGHTDGEDSATGASYYAPHFRIASATAEKIIGEVRSAVSNWQDLARQFDIPPGEQERMQPAFAGGYR